MLYSVLIRYYEYILEWILKYSGYNISSTIYNNGDVQNMAGKNYEKNGVLRILESMFEHMGNYATD